MAGSQEGPGLFKVKVCGLTRRQDAQLALDCGADALGFIGVVQSPRYIGTAGVRVMDWLDRLPRTARRILVVRDLALALEPWCAAFDGFQFFTDDTGAARRLGDRILLKVVRPRLGQDPAALVSDAGETPAIVVDAYSPDALGGTGLRADWSCAAALVAMSPVPVVLAGGLRADTVAEAIAAVRPHGVDVSSGIEASPGVKDPVQLAAFVQSACSALSRGDRNVT